MTALRRLDPAYRRRQNFHEAPLNPDRTGPCTVVCRGAPVSGRGEGCLTLAPPPRARGEERFPTAHRREGGSSRGRLVATLRNPLRTHPQAGHFLVGHLLGLEVAEFNAASADGAGAQVAFAGPEAQARTHDVVDGPAELEAEHGSLHSSCGTRAVTDSSRRIQPCSAALTVFGSLVLMRCFQSTARYCLHALMVKNSVVGLAVVVASLLTTHTV